LAYSLIALVSGLRVQAKAGVEQTMLRAVVRQALDSLLRT
jgi:hypothetical protein